MGSRRVAIGTAGVGFEIVCAAALALSAPPEVWVVLLVIGLGFIGYAFFVGDPEDEAEALSEAVADGGDGDGDLRGNVFGDNANVSITKHAPPATGSPPRRLLSRTVDELTMTYREHTTLEAEKLVGPYIGGWICIQGKVYNVSVRAPNDHRVTLHEVEKGGPRALVFLAFVRDAQDDAARLRKDESISVIGRLSEVDQLGIGLTDCEFVD